MDFHGLTNYSEELSILMQQYEEANVPVMKIEAFIAMSKEQRSIEKEALFTDQLDSAIQARKAALAVLSKRTKRESIDAVRDFLDELTTKINITAKLRQNAFNARAGLEFNIRLGNYPSDEERAAAEGKTSEATRQYEEAVAITAEMIPLTSSLVLV